MSEERPWQIAANAADPVGRAVKRAASAFADSG
jgi:hypothetical protein